MLYNILKVSQNLMGGKCEKFAEIELMKRKNFLVKLKIIVFGKTIILNESTFSDL